MDSKDHFRVRLNCLDHYQASPTPLDAPIWGPNAVSSTQRNNLPQVPVIRVFGATETGQKVCLHIHGAFPYLFVPYEESIGKSHVDAYISTFRHSIDHALALSYRRNPYDNPRSAAFVAHISLVKGVPFFGYNVGYKYYLKIYLLNPLHMTRLTDLLHQGAILKRIFQPYEAHLQYLLQWMCDFNLYGCAYVETQNPHFREPVPVWEGLDNPGHLWHNRSIPSAQILDVDRFPRQSHCQLELDIRVEDILNRNSIQARSLHHSFVERLSTMENLPPEEKLVHSMAGLWKDETRRRKLRMGLTDPSSSPFPAEVLVSMSADPRSHSDGGWIHEEEFRQAVTGLAQQEKRARGGGDLSFESFGTQGPSREGDGVQTVLESVQELFNAVLEQKWTDLASDQEFDEGIDVDFDVPGSDPRRTSVSQAPIVDVNSITQIAYEGDCESDEEIAKELAQSRLQNLRDPDPDQPAAKAEISGDSAEDVDDSDDSSPTSGVESLKRHAPPGSQEAFKKSRLATGEASTETTAGKFRIRDIRPPRKFNTTARKSATDFNPPPGAQKGASTSGDFPAEIPPSAQPPSSQKSSRLSQNIRDSFPLIKNATGHDAPLRLSQKDDSSHNSQQLSKLSQGEEFLKSSNEWSASQSTLKSPNKSTISINPRLPERYTESFTVDVARDVFIFGPLPPSVDQVNSTIDPPVIYQEAYYSNEKDVPERPREYAGQEFRLVSNTVPYLQPFDKSGAVREGKAILHDRATTDLAEQRRRKQCSIRVWEIMKPPPTVSEVEKWLREESSPQTEDPNLLGLDGPPSASQLKRKNRPAADLSQFDLPTQKNKNGFKFSQKKGTTSVQHETGYMSTMSLEVHVNSRGDLAPDPERDEVNLVIWCIVDEQMENDTKVGIVVLTKDDDTLAHKIRRTVGADVQVDAEDNELDLINKMVDTVREYDPDMLTGYEVHNSSWGYLIERARLQYEFNLPDEFSRMKSKSHGRFGKDADRWGFTHTSTVRITGRHTINIWRAMRSELNLLQYTMENVVFHLLHQRIPHYSFQTLTAWYQSGRPRDLAKVLNYFISRTKFDIDILNANELIPRTSEQARLLGVDFFSVFSRGSQFKVESLMFRIAKPESFLLVSPSRKQVGSQNALECLPLVMEPQSAFYTSPVLVLDFQSLYPSVMIAYNYCYSTCLGRITEWRGANKLGFADFKRTPGLLELVQDKVNISPNGMMFVKPEMRKSLLAKMLGEILETRVMVKSGMKVDKHDKTLQQLLNNRQLALKLIANVTYGYTSASFSGRMPCSEIADSIVQTGRETLEKAIAYIHSVERWGAEVVYGDTDSLFIHLKGRTRDTAFRIGEEIAAAITAQNPRPIKLKFEKVYHPCLLLAKKRYVGHKFDSPTQLHPDFDAKGIETVRRDGTPATQALVKTTLKLLFRTSDLSAIKLHFQTQCTKLLTSRTSIADLIFAKEVKLGTYVSAPAGALLATKHMLADPRLEPQHGARIPYIVVTGAPGSRLRDRTVDPLRSRTEAVDAEYYITKSFIPPLERILNLVGANVQQWYAEMAKPRRTPSARGKSKLEAYLASSACVNCHIPLPSSTATPLCTACRTPQTLATLHGKIQTAERKLRDLRAVCVSCSGDGEVRCESQDCQVFWSRTRAVGRAEEDGVRSRAVRDLERELEW